MDSPKKKMVEKPQDGRQKSSQNIGNPYQMEDNKAAPSATPPWGFLLSAFGKDFLCFGLTSEAHSGSIFIIEIGRFSEFSQGSSEKV